MPPKKIVSLNLRMPPDLHKALVKAAETNKPPTSLNHEIVRRLYESLEANNG